MGKTSIVHNLGSHLESSHSEDWKFYKEFDCDDVTWIALGLDHMIMASDEPSHQCYLAFELFY